jgi:hypothetical protein
MDGWCSVEELTQWGFGHAPVLMANEAHSGMRRCVRTPAGEWIPMGCHFPGLSGIVPFVVDETVSVDFGHGAGDWQRELLDGLSDTLAAHDGTAGILCGQAPESPAGWPADAVIVSTDNALS